MPDDETYNEADAPAGFSLAAEAGHSDEAARGGMVARDVEPEPDDIDLDDEGEDGGADDDDAIDDPDEAEDAS